MTRIRRPLDLGNVIKDRRGELGLTQAQLADAALLTRQWVSGFENGRNTASVKFTDLAAMLDALDLELDVRPRGARG